MKLNVGCGPDKWGDIRLDVAKEFLGLRTFANVIGDAQNLPFRDFAFSEVKASHVIEHLPLWQQALREWIRVCNNLLILRFPVNEEFKRHMILGFLTLTPSRVKNSIKSMKSRLHVWVINPKVVSRVLERNDFKVSVTLKNRAICHFYGRKGRLISKLLRRPLYIKYEYEIVARKK